MSFILELFLTVFVFPSFLAVFVMQRDGHARLDFIQNMEYKFVELLSCDFVASPEETVRQQISFRYNSVKTKLSLMQARLQVRSIFAPRRVMHD